MSIIDDLVTKCIPHTDYLTDTIDFHGEEIHNHLLGLSRPDTADDWHFIINNGEIKGEIKEKKILGGPKLGEVWFVQSICVNGEPHNSPGFTIRTNTGRLIFICKPKEMGSQTIGGDTALLQGEILEFEPESSGVFDYTISMIRHKGPQYKPDAGFGVDEVSFEDRRVKHETSRDDILQ